MLKSRLLRGAVARYGLVMRGFTLGVRVAAIDADRRVVLVRHGYAPGWHLPGGGVEIAETAEEAAARELLEETGLTVRGRPGLFGFYFNPMFGGRDHVALYRVDAFDRGPEPAPNREIAQRGWFPLDAPPPDATAATRRRLLELSGLAAPDARW